MASASKRPKLGPRFLPPELLAEMHKCMPFEQQIDLLVCVPSRVIYLNNASRVRRTIQQIRELLHDYVIQYHDIQQQQDWLIETDEETEVQPYANFFICSKRVAQCQWEPMFGPLIRFGAAFTPTQNFWLITDCHFVGEPENLVEHLTFQLAKSRSMPMLKSVSFKLDSDKYPQFLAPLLDDDNIGYWNGHRKLFGTFALNAGNARKLNIIDGYLHEAPRKRELRLFIANTFNENKWFEVHFDLLDELNRIERLHFGYKEISPLDEIVLFKNDPWNASTYYLEQPGNGELFCNSDTEWNQKWDMFLRRGAEFTQFRHFRIGEGKILRQCPAVYEEELIRYMAETSHPEHMLERIDLKISNVYLFRNETKNEYSKSLLHKIWTTCYGMMHSPSPAADQPRTVLHDKREFKIEQGEAKVARSEIHKAFGQVEMRQIYWMEFTLTNGPTNGQYVFDIEAEFPKSIQMGHFKEVAMKIRRRTIG